MVTVPGINISILRQRTTARRGEPLLISGRVSALGLGVPALVRVDLEGPAFDPQVVTFETLSAPTGDYNVAVMADKEGRYTVRAQAFPALASLPLLGGLLPPLAESPSPPIVVGQPEDGAVVVDGRRVAPPPPTQVEVRAPVQVGAPAVTIVSTTPAARAVPFLPLAPPGETPDVPPPTVITGPPALDEEEPGVTGAQIAGFELEG